MSSHGQSMRFAHLLLITSIGCSSGSGDSTPLPGEESDSAQIGAEGGTLAAQGVRVDIPPGAMTSTELLTLSVLPGPVVQVQPDILFNQLVTVTLDSRYGLAPSTVHAQHLTDGEGYLIDEGETLSDGSYSFQTLEFSKNWPAPIYLIEECYAPWKVSEVCDSPFESSETILPQVSRTSVYSGCLADASDIVGSRYDEPYNRDSTVIRPEDEAWTMSYEAAAALEQARTLVLAELPGYDIWVNGAWDSTGLYHGKRSYHYFGAALDLVLCEDGCTSADSKVHDEAVLGLLPPLLLQAGFTWIWYEDKQHLHASISSPTLEDCRGVPVSAGWDHSLALTESGLTGTWGGNDWGQLGNGTTASLNTPGLLSTLDTVRTVAAGEGFSLALKSDGTVWAWGSNNWGQLGSGTWVDPNLDGAPTLTPVQVVNLGSVLRLAAGGYHSLALKDDATVWAWGSDYAGALGNGSGTQTSTCEVNDSGLLICTSSTPVQVIDLGSVQAIAAGHESSYALQSDGTVWAWGYSYYGIGDGSTGYIIHPSPVQVEGLDSVVEIAAGYVHALARRNDMTVWEWGTTSSATPVRVNISSVTHIAAGGWSSFAIKSDGSVWAWGDNTYGQLGDGTTTSWSSPVQVKGLSSVIDIDGGEKHSIALKEDGSVWAWGDNEDGQLGNGTNTGSLVPIKTGFVSK